jgi:transposase
MALIVGIDLGRKSAHDAVILKRETGLEIGRGFRFTSSPEGFHKLFRKIEAARSQDEPVDFVIDSPGRAWIPVAAVLKATGFRVYRPSAYRVKKVREAGHRRNKTNRIDALTLARCLRNYPKDTALVFLPQGDHARLDQIVRQRSIRALRSSQTASSSTRPVVPSCVPTSIPDPSSGSARNDSDSSSRNAIGSNSNPTPSTSSS